MKDIYCKICTSCGVDGCCSATVCENHKDGLYCESNLMTLRINYYTLREFYNWIYLDEDKFREVIDKLNDINDKIEDEFYKK